MLPESATDCDSSDAEASQKDTDSRLFVISQEGNQQSESYCGKKICLLGIMGFHFTKMAK